MSPLAAKVKCPFQGGEANERENINESEGNTES
jgi:hypothetical protein